MVLATHIENKELCELYEEGHDMVLALSISIIKGYEKKKGY